MSPRAKAGLNILEASSEPDAPPAPTMVCSSSINKITSGDFSNSFITAFIRSSNWPRYFVPATKEAKSSVMTLLPNNILDTFFWIILNASPSAMAVLPTPGSPIKTGLFFLRRLRICATRSISFSRPTIGSNFPISAIFVKSRPKLSSTGVLDFSAFGSLPCAAPEPLPPPPLLPNIPPFLSSSSSVSGPA